MTKPIAAVGRLAGMRHLLRLLALGLVLIMAACSSASPSASGPAGAAAATPSPSLEARPTPSLIAVSPIGTVYTGVLSFDEIEGGCAYLQALDGRKLQVNYPDGWQVKPSPLSLIAPDGSVHSRGGDTVSVRGSEASDMASICQIGPIILAEEVLDQ